MKLTVLLLTILGGATVIASFLGVLHPIGDSLAVFRLPMAAGLAGLSLVTLFIRWRLALICFTIAAVGFATVFAAHLLPTRDGNTLTVYQKNLSFRMGDPLALQRDIQAAMPDVVTMQEMSAPLKAIIPALKDTHPHHAFCPFHQVVGGVAVVSRYPIEHVQCVAGFGMVAAQIAPNNKPIWVVSLHLHWPWPYRQREQLAEILPMLESLTGKIVIGGDFNMVPWSHALRKIRRATGTKRSKEPYTTFTRFGALVPLVIDNVLSPGGGSTQTRAALGSDHLGVLATVSLGPTGD